MLQSILAQIEYPYRVCYTTIMMRKESLFEPICMYLKTHPDTAWTRVLWARRWGTCFQGIYRLFSSILAVLSYWSATCRESVSLQGKVYGPASINLERFIEALHDPSTNLTYPALTGSRKQSIQDVETLFSKEMESFMEQKGYLQDARYIHQQLEASLWWMESQWWGTETIQHRFSGVHSWWFNALA